MTGQGTSDGGYVVRFGRLEQRGVLLGLSGPRLTWVAIAVVVFVSAEFTTGWVGVAVTAPVWATTAALGLAFAAGRPLLEWVPLLGGWTWRRARSATTLRFDLTRRARDGDLVLPDRGRRRVLTTPDGTAVIQDRRTGALVVVAEVSGPGFLLADAGVQDGRVTAWGRMLGALCRRDDITRVQVLHLVTPGGGVAVRRWWVEHALGQNSWANRVLAEAVTDAEQHTDRHQTLIAFAIRGGRTARTSSVIEAADHAIPTLTQMLTAAELSRVQWLTVHGLRHVVRTAYDPNAAHLDLSPPTRAAARRRDQGGVVGPMAVEESWDRLHTDTAWHAVSWIAQWPRTATRTDFLTPLIAAPGTHRSLSLTIEPVSTTRALREVRRARIAHAADAAQRHKAGRVEDHGMLAEADDVTRRELDLVAGHGDLAFTGLVVVTAPTSEALDGACAAIETAAAQSRCELRRLSGQQAAAHAIAALPLAAGVHR